jgi:hypothetical protein
MLNGLHKSFDHLFKDFTWSKATFLFLMLVLGAVSLFLYESYTATFKLKRINTELSVIDKLVDLEKKVASLPDESPSKKYFERVIANSQGEDIGLPLEMGAPSLATQRLIYQFIPWVVFYLFLAFSTPRDWIQNIFAVLLVASPFVAAGYNLKQFEMVAINNWFIPWGLFIFFMSSIVLWQRLKSTQQG